MKVHALAEILHVTPQAIISVAWLELGLKKNAESNLSTEEAVRLRELLVKMKASPRHSKNPVSQNQDKTTNISAICKRHRILTVTPSRQTPQAQLPSGWRDHLVPAARKHLALPSQEVPVQLSPRLKASIHWPAAYIEGNEFFFIGETVPVNLRTISRPYNFLLQEVGGKPRPIILRRYWGEASSEYTYLYTKTGITGLLNQPPSAWKPCDDLQLPKSRLSHIPDARLLKA